MGKPRMIFQHWNANLLKLNPQNNSRLTLYQFDWPYKFFSSLSTSLFHKPQIFVYFSTLIIYNLFLYTYILEWVLNNFSIIFWTKFDTTIFNLNFFWLRENIYTSINHCHVQGYFFHVTKQRKGGKRQIKSLSTKRNAKLKNRMSNKKSKKKLAINWKVKKERAFHQ